MYNLVKIINGTVQSPGWAINLVILSKWFPRVGRGVLIGCWATNASLGDIVGTWIYQRFSTDTEFYKPFFAVGGLSLVVGILNFLFLFESPQ